MFLSLAESAENDTTMVSTNESTTMTITTSNETATMNTTSTSEAVTLATQSFILASIVSASLLAVVVRF